MREGSSGASLGNGWIGLLLLAETGRGCLPLVPLPRLWLLFGRGQRAAGDPVDFCLLESSELRVLAASLLGEGLGRVGADLGRVACVTLDGLEAAGFLGGPALPDGGAVLARAEAPGLAAAAAFPSIGFGAMLARDRPRSVGPAERARSLPGTALALQARSDQKEKLWRR